MMLDLTRNNIAACQVHKRPPTSLFVPEFRSGLVLFKERSLSNVQKSLGKVLALCARKAFLAILPETSVPIELIPYLCKQAVKFDLTIIAGLEHKVSWLPSSAREKNYRTGAYRVENELIVVWPHHGKNVEHARKNYPAIVNEHSVVERIERSVEPEFLMVTVPAPDGREIKVWPILCSDFLELASQRMLSHDELERTIRAQDVDLIAVLSHTHRADAFRNTMVQLMAGGKQRPLFTNLVFTNLAFYGQSMCLAYTDRAMLRGNADDAEFWRARTISAGEESCCLFTNWASALEEAQRTRRS